MDKKRIFVALPLPRELLDTVRTYQRLLASIEGVNILSEDGLHLTIIPPWDEPNPDAVVRDLSAISSDSFTIKVEAAEYRPQLAWLRGELSLELERLNLQTWRAIMSHDPQRTLLPHITLARFPEGREVPVLPPVNAIGTIDRIALYESLPGYTYRIIGEKTLG